MTTSYLNRAALLGVAALTALAIAGCGAAGSATTSASDAMSGHSMTGESMTTTDHAMATTQSSMGSHGSHGSQNMQGMTALEAGADGTHASAGGLTLEPARTTIAAGGASTLGLRVVDAKGMPVTRFQRDQTKLMHLIVVRDDLSRFQHIHPVLGTNGRFSVAVTLPDPGRYRAIADFATRGKRYALGTTITAPGTAVATQLPAPTTMAMTDGYSVRLSDTAMTAGKEATLVFSVSKGGKPVSELQPYLGAYGHLVALHKPGLAYSHVHPVTHNAMKGTIGFAADFPKPGTYRLFLQFRASGIVHTAPFTVVVKT